MSDRDKKPWRSVHASQPKIDQRLVQVEEKPCLEHEVKGSSLGVGFGDGVD